MSGYIDKRRSENRGPCTSCGKNDDACTASVLRHGTACCGRCRVTETHPKPSDPREGRAMPVQGSMLSDPESIEVAPVKPYAEEHGDAGGNRDTLNLGTRQAQAVAHLGNAGRDGHTVVELRSLMDAHHGTVSGALSELHKGGIISRLKVQRKRCSVYVMPEYVGDREAIPPKPTKAALAARVLECEGTEDGDGTPIVMYQGEGFYLATDLLDALTEGFHA